MIRLGNIADLDSIMNVIKAAQNRMKKAGMTQWQNNYPNIEILTDDINNNALYVYELNGTIVGTMSVFSFDSVYADINGKWLNNNPYIVIHRMALSNEYTNQGFAAKMINYLFKHFNINDIRIDTHPKNIPMIKSLEKQGFIKCGTVHVTTDADSLRLAYHKHLDNKRIAKL